MVQLEPSPGLESQRRWLGFSLVLLSLLDITWTEVLAPPVPEQAPTLQGKGHLGKDRSQVEVLLRS